MNALDPLFNPRGIAVVGASAEPSRPGAQTLATLKEQGYRGDVYPVNPKYSDLQGYRCYARIADIEGACDLAVIALPAPAVPAMIGQCAGRGIRFAVVLGGGFRESGAEGAKIEAAMLDIARRQGVRLIGPNCLGLVNVHARAYAAWGSLTRPPHVTPGPVSAVLQSASFGVSTIIQCAAAGVGFRYIVTSGNEADITAPELIDAYVDDHETHAILAYLEGVADGRAFMAAARRALVAHKPLVVIKAGNTTEGKRAAASHTANLTGNYDVYRAAFHQCGVIEAHDVDEAVDALRCAVNGRIPKGRRVAVMGGSGGAAAMFSDEADAAGLVLPSFTPNTLEVLKASLPPLSSLENPLDYTAGYPRAQQGLDFERAFAAALDDPQIDQLAVMFAAAGRKQLQYGGEVLAKVAASREKPIMVFSAMTDELAPEGLAMLRAAGIPVFSSAKRVAATMAKLALYAEALERASRSAEVPPAAESAPLKLPRGAATLSEHDSKRLIAKAGVPVTSDSLLPLDPDAKACAALRFPLALKIVSPDITHKTDVGGVRLGIRSAQELRVAASEIIASARRAMPQAHLTGLLTSEMVSDAVETIVGVINDPGFGPVVVFGLGGILTEALHDVAYRVAPFGLDDARAMLNELRARSIFAGLRGQAPRDVD
ncbi:MAG TPA: acetate--CoA ligase family protein, partial [Burkholderiales bacterium]|nr:acetate--CoA ligase family protein [Burkholderiales bacterium]